MARGLSRSIRNNGTRPTDHAIPRAPPFLPVVIGARVRHIYAVIEMQFARAPVVVEPVSDIRILLDFTNGYAGADRVNSSRRNQNNIARVHLPPIE